MKIDSRELLISQLTATCRQLEKDVVQEQQLKEHEETRKQIITDVEQKITQLRSRITFKTELDAEDSRLLQTKRTLDEVKKQLKDTQRVLKDAHKQLLHTQKKQEIQKYQAQQRAASALKQMLSFVPDSWNDIHVQLAQIKKQIETQDLSLAQIQQTIVEYTKKIQSKH